MTSSSHTAAELLRKYKKSDALIQATQCYYMANTVRKGHWWNVIEKIKNDGE